MKLFVLSVCAAIALAGVIWAESTDRTDVENTIDVSRPTSRHSRIGSAHPHLS